MPVLFGLAALVFPFVFIGFMQTVLAAFTWLMFWKAFLFFLLACFFITAINMLFSSW